MHYSSVRCWNGGEFDREEDQRIYGNSLYFLLNLGVNLKLLFLNDDFLKSSIKYIYKNFKNLILIYSI